LLSGTAVVFRTAAIFEQQAAQNIGSRLPPAMKFSIEKFHSYIYMARRCVALARK